MPDFREDDGRDLTPEEKAKAEFDWVALDENLAEFDRLDLSPEAASGLHSVLRVIFDWDLEPMQNQRLTRVKQLELVARRVIALAWVLEPSRFGSDPSMSDVAASIGVSKAMLSDLTAEVSRRFGVRNRHQLHGGNFKKEKK